MARRSSRSLSVPITLAAVAVPLSIALLIGWTLVIVQNTALTREVTQNVWLLVLGALSFLVITVVLIIFSVVLGREILEVRKQNSFIDSVTHELKSPLASIKLCLETLAREEVSPAQREQLRRMMLEDVDRLSSFIDDVLQASRLAHDRTGLSLSEVNLAEVVHRCAEMVVARHELDPDAITFDLAPDLTVTTDRTALEIVLKNLFDNAIKYSEAPPHVTVSARLDEQGRMIIDVQDQGIGVPPRQLKRIFQRFYRVPSERVRERRGTGLGLFVVSALMRNLGGTVDAHSAGPGRGTTMHVVLPAPHDARRQAEGARAAVA